MKVFNPDLKGQDKVPMMLLCLVLGPYGIHNFMMGEIKKAVLKLALTVLCCGTGMILNYIDFVKMAINAYEINPDKFI